MAKQLTMKISSRNKEEETIWFLWAIFNCFWCICWLILTEMYHHIFVTYARYLWYEADLCWLLCLTDGIFSFFFFIWQTFYIYIAFFTPFMNNCYWIRDNISLTAFKNLGLRFFFVVGWLSVIIQTGSLLENIFEQNKRDVKEKQLKNPLNKKSWNLSELPYRDITKSELNVSYNINNSESVNWYIEYFMCICFTVFVLVIRCEYQLVRMIEN